MAPKVGEVKQVLPGYSTGVRANSAVRMVKLVRPICPNSKLKMVRDADTGKWVPADIQPQNCQLMGGEWWKYCEEQGHDPYWTNRVWYSPQDIIEEDEDGNQIVTGTKRIKHVNRYPNIAQVSASIRHNSGQGAKRKIQLNGFKRLADVGFEEVCQFRNCQKPLDPKFSNTNYGSYCSLEHLSLIGADVEGILLHYPDVNLNGQEYDKIRKARAKQLREAAQGA